MPQMTDYIHMLADEVGPRPVNTEEEHDSALRIASWYRKRSASVDVEEFNTPTWTEWPLVIAYLVMALGAGFSFIKGAGGIIFIVLAFAALGLFVYERYFNGQIADRRATGLSQNVVARYVPASVAGDPRRRKVVIVAHYDSERTALQYANSLVDSYPIIQKIMLGIMIGVPVLLVVSKLPFVDAIHQWIWLFSCFFATFALISGIVLLLNHFVTKYSDGANSNASGVAVMTEVYNRIVPEGETGENGVGAAVRSGRSSRSSRSSASDDEDRPSRSGRSRSERSERASSRRSREDAVDFDVDFDEAPQGADVAAEGEEGGGLKLGKFNLSLPFGKGKGRAEGASEGRSARASRSEGRSSEGGGRLDRLRGKIGFGNVDEEPEGDVSERPSREERASRRAARVHDEETAYASGAADLDTEVTYEDHRSRNRRDAEAVLEFDTELPFDAGRGEGASEGFDYEGRMPEPVEPEMTDEEFAAQFRVENPARSGSFPRTTRTSHTGEFEALAASVHEEPAPESESADDEVFEYETSIFREEEPEASASFASHGGEAAIPERKSHRESESSKQRNVGIEQPGMKTSGTSSVSARKVGYHGDLSAAANAPKEDNVPEWYKKVASKRKENPSAEPDEAVMKARSRYADVPDRAYTRPEPEPEPAPEPEVVAEEVAPEAETNSVDSLNAASRQALDELMAKGAENFEYPVKIPSVESHEDEEAARAAAAKAEAEASGASAAGAAIADIIGSGEADDIFMSMSVPADKTAAFTPEDLAEAAKPSFDKFEEEPVLDEPEEDRFVTAAEQIASDRAARQLDELERKTRKPTPRGGANPLMDRQGSQVPSLEDDSFKGLDTLRNVPSDHMPSLISDKSFGAPQATTVPDEFVATPQRAGASGAFSKLPTIEDEIEGTVSGSTQGVEFAAGTFAAGGTGAFVPVSNSQSFPAVGRMDDDLFVDDADDSAVQMQPTVGDFSAPSSIDIPESRAHRFADGLSGIFGRKKKHEDDTSASEWLGVDEDFNATREGEDIGSWDNFNEDDHWKGGAAYHPGDGLEIPDIDGPAEEPEFLDLEESVDSGEYYEDLGATGEITGTINPDELKRAARTMATQDFIDKEVWFVALGAHGAGEAGMKAFLDAHSSELAGAMIINLDCVGAGEICYLEEEGIGRSFRSDHRIQVLIRKLARELGGNVEIESLKWASTDATVALRAGHRAVTLMGFDRKAPFAWKQKNDTASNIEQSRLELTADLLEAMVREC